MQQSTGLPPPPPSPPRPPHAPMNPQQHMAAGAGAPQHGAPIPPPPLHAHFAQVPGMGARGSGVVPTEYHRTRFTINEPPPGQARSWYNCRKEQVSSPQDVMKALVKKENRTGKYGEPYLRTVKDMSPVKVTQLRGHIDTLNRMGNPQFEWQLAYLKLHMESEGKMRYTRSMDAIFRRIPRRHPPVDVFRAQHQQPAVHQSPGQHPGLHAGQQHPHMQGGREEPIVSLGVAALDDDDDDDEDDDPRGKKKSKKNKGHKGGAVIHQIRPKNHHTDSSHDDSSSEDSLWDSAPENTPPSSVSGHTYRKGRGGYRRSSSSSSKHLSGGLRQHTRRHSRVEVRPGHGLGSRRPASSSESYYPTHSSHGPSDRQRRAQETDIKLARLEGMFEGMNIANANNNPQSPQLQIDDRRYPDSSYRASRYNDRGDWFQPASPRFHRGDFRR